MEIREKITQSSEEQVKETLNLIMTTYLSPAFGSLSKHEADILMFTVLERIGYIEENPSLYSLVQKLRVTRSKARNLLYDRELRRLNEKELDVLVKEMLKHPLIQKQGELFVLEIENPLVIDHLKSKLQKLGHTSDGSFSSSLVKLSDGAIVALLDGLLDDAHKEEVRMQFIKAGLPDKSFKGILKDVLKALGKKAADEAGSKIVEGVLGPVIDGAFEGIPEALVKFGIAKLFEKPKKDKPAE